MNIHIYIYIFIYTHYTCITLCVLQLVNPDRFSGRSVFRIFNVQCSKHRATKWNDSPWHPTSLISICRSWVHSHDHMPNLDGSSAQVADSRI